MKRGVMMNSQNKSADDCCRAGHAHRSCCHLMALWLVVGVAEVAE